MLEEHTELCLLLASCWFLSWLIPQPWRWRWHVPPKRWQTLNRLHSITSQKTEEPFMTTAVRISCSVILILVTIEAKNITRDTDVSFPIWVWSHSCHPCFTCKVKVKFSLYRQWRPLGLQEVDALAFSDIWLIDGGKVVSPTCWPLFTPRKIPDTHFC
jgi:hypothetical protein